MRLLTPYSEHLRRRLGKPTYKVVVASGLTCPTRDGTIDTGGCAFCDVRGSSSFHGKRARGQAVRDQLALRMPEMAKRFGVEQFVAYFQSYTNTYTDDVDYLRELYSEAIAVPGVVGLAIGTRPDCLAAPVVELLAEFAERTYVSLELGVQSFEDTTLEWLKRGHSGECSIEAISRVRRDAPRVEVSAHLIFGSPTDSASAPEDAARLLSDLGVHGAKLHQLMVLEHTELARRYRSQPFATLSLEEYAERVGRFLDHLDPAIFIERLSALATHTAECIAPEWSRDRWLGHNRLRELLMAQGVAQGRRHVTRAISRQPEFGPIYSSV